MHMISAAQAPAMPLEVSNRIPKILHFIWVGDDSKRPDNCIATWERHHPDWTIRIWGNRDLTENEWVNAPHIKEMWGRELNGVADMMRWEILYNEGGVVLDADSICVRALDEDLLDCRAFACWESEIARPGLIAAGYFGAEAQNPFIGQIILDIQNEASVVNDMAWKTVGPQRLTDSFRKYEYHDLKIYPSHYFIPQHFSGLKYNGDGPVYAHQLWGSTRAAYDEISLLNCDEGLPNVAEQTDYSIRPEAVVDCDRKPANDQSDDMAAQSSLEQLHEPYFVQHVQVSTDIANVNRLDVLATMCAGKRVLHIGCADWPITDPKASLHLALEPHCLKLDGFDIHAEALEALAPYVRDSLFSDMAELTGEYDIVLVPEVMEHVPDIQGFLAQLDTLNAPYYIMSVPDAYQCFNRHFDYIGSTQTFVEVVHPDHNCWYTPYTFSNVIAKYTDWKIEHMWFFNRISLLALITKS